MKRAIIALAISIIAILGINLLLGDQQTAKDECDDMQEETYFVCREERNYFKENLK